MLHPGGIDHNKVKYREIDIPTLSYVFLKEGIEDSGNTVTASNMSMPQGLKPIIIPY